MTGTALLLGMFSFKCVAGLGMIKTLLAVLPIDQVKVTSMMFNMAFLALLMRSISVEPFVVVNLLSENGMAGQTFGRSDSFTNVVTFCAIFDSFQICVRFV